MQLTSYLKFILLCLLFILPIRESFSQAAGEYWELGAFGGVTQYYGDLNENYFNSDEMHHAVGAFLRYSPNKHFSIRGGFYIARVSGSDEHATVQSRRIRNLHFRSDISEFSAIVEWNILGLNFRRLNYDDFTPYIFAGVGVFRFNPQAEFNDEWVNLQPLNTEGQGFTEYPDRDPYALTQFTIPFGVGVKYQVSHNVMLAFEIAPRKTFTDYLDDVSTTHVDHDLLRQRKGEIAVLLSDRSWELDNFDQPQSVEGSQRGNPDDNDWYAFFGFTLSINLTKELCSLN